MLNAFEKVYDINKERKKLLESYVRMIKKSQESLNLIGRSTISNIWERHIIDSIQILNHQYHCLHSIARLLFLRY